MRRVAVIGPGGAGKTQLARELGARLGLPVVDLDRLYWRPGWVETPHEEFAALQERLVAEECWVMDGNYGGTMEIRPAAADTVVLLDLHPALCTWRVFRRTLACKLSGRPYLGPERPERLGDLPTFLAYVARYRRMRVPVVLERVARHSARLHHLRTRRDVRRFLARLGA